MVRKGDYTVRLVDAETKQPFKEHVAPDGKIYAEVEPDAEYFVELEVVDGPEERVSYFQTYVDGNKLEQYFWSKRDHGSHLEGLASYQNGVWNTKSLRFQPPKIVPDDGEEEDMPPSMTAMMGSVKVRISVGIFVTTTDSDFKGGLSKEETEVTLNGKGLERKTVRTVAGKAHASTSKEIVAEANAPKDTWEVYVDGELLEEVEIHYCTALGLIYAGILPKPPLYDYYRLQQGLPKRTNEDQATLDVPLKRIKVDAVYDDADGAMLAPGKEYDLFDLTELSDEDDNVGGGEPDDNDYDTANEDEDPVDMDDSDKENSKPRATKPVAKGGVGGLFVPPPLWVYHQ